MRPAFISTDNLSEISETGTGRTGSTSERSAYSENREELLAILGLTDGDRVFQEKFRIYRRKLEEMIISDNESLDNTSEFFRRVMDGTGTHITWPSRLKIGGKSKKDPFVRIAGRCPEDVQRAKESVLATLEIRNNQVTMKISVSYTHHSHIIGEGGQTISKIRRDTDCHIHFPDSNRSAASEIKSNLVSITGTLENVERARARMRELVPLVFMFEMQMVRNIGGFKDSHYPYIQQVSDTFNVNVSCRTRSRLHGNLVVVKGCEWEVDQVKEATVLLINHLCGSAGQVPVQMTMEISPQHHSIVLGPQSQYLKSIMDTTQTQILFPDASDPNIPLLKKSKVSIIGDIDNVYLARQQIMGSLPINLIFNRNGDCPNVTSDKITQIADMHDVAISTRQCPKQNTCSVMIRGVERNVGGIYESYAEVLNVPDKVQVTIPETYLLTNPPKVFNNNELNDNTSNRPLSTLLTPETMCGMSPFSLQDSPIILTQNMLSQLWSQQVAPMMAPLPWNRVLMSPQQQMPPRLHHPSAIPVSNRDISANTSGYGSQPSFTQYNSLSTSPASEPNPLSGACCSSISSTTSFISTPGVSPRNLSPIASGVDHQLSLDLANMLKTSSDWSGSRNLSVDCNLTPSDYEKKKFMAMRALQNMPSSSEMRVPTSTWTGYGFSSTSPSVLYTDSKPQNIQYGGLTREYDTDPWAGATDVLSPDGTYYRHSNAIESIPSGMLRRLQTSYSDLPALLASMGLEKYIHLFRSQEIDLDTFEMFTAENLKEIGVHPYGARHKMLLAIADLKKRRFVSAAPGAERQRYPTADEE